MGVGAHGCAEVVPFHEEGVENGGGVERLRCIIAGEVGERGSGGVTHHLNSDVSEEILLGEGGGCHAGEECRRDELVDGLCLFREIGIGRGGEEGEGLADVGEEEVGIGEERCVSVEEGGIVLVEEGDELFEEFGVMGFAEPGYKHIDIGPGEDVAACIFGFHFLEGGDIIGGLESEEEAFELVSVFRFRSDCCGFGSWSGGMEGDGRGCIRWDQSEQRD